MSSILLSILGGKMSQYKVPNPVIDNKEEASLFELTERYKKMCEPKMIAQFGRKISELIPDKLKSAVKAMGETITEQELYGQIMEVVSKGLNTIMEIAARYTIPRASIIKSIDLATAENVIMYSSEICLARGYHISKLVDKYRTGDLAIALVEGAGTGAFGFPAIPFNLVLITFICYRAVQNVAMYYGYDVKEDPSELMIASEVLSQALSPSTSGGDDLSGTVLKVMTYGEIAAVKDSVQKGFAAMIEKGGLPKLLVKLRALASKAAQKALKSAGEKGLENTTFKHVFEQIGKKLTQKNIKSKVVPGLGAILGAIFDVNQMSTVIAFADTFYNKRFILEKGARINQLLGNPEIIEVDSEVEE